MRIGDRRLPSTSIWRQVQVHEERLENYAEQPQEQVSGERVVLPDMRYDHADPQMVSIEGGLPIGSGTAESGVQQFKHRLCGVSMRWQENNAHQMLIIRTAVLSDQFDPLWQNVPLH